LGGRLQFLGGWALFTRAGDVQTLFSSCPTTPTNKEHKISLSHKERTLSVWAKKKDYSLGGHLLLFHLQQKCF